MEPSKQEVQLSLLDIYQVYPVRLSHPVYMRPGEGGPGWGGGGGDSGFCLLRRLGLFLGLECEFYYFWGFGEKVVIFFFFFFVFFLFLVFGH